MRRASLVARALAAIALFGGVAAGPAPASAAPPPTAILGPNAIGEPRCYDPTQSNADFEAYGPTDVNAQAGNGRVTVGVNSAGTITVFKFPNPSYYNQVKYLTVGRDAHGKVLVQFPNEGAFAGIRYRTAAGEGFAWLRDWSASQRYDSEDTPVPVTTYTAPGRLGLRVTQVDLVAAAGDVFQRELFVDRTPGSPVMDATLVFYENFNPIGTRIRYVPATDWCFSQASDQAAAYDAGAHAIVHSWQGLDAASGQAVSLAFAFGWDGADSAHQVGADGYDPATLPGGAADGFDQEASPSHRLGGADAATGQVTGALETRLDFGAHNRATARLTIGAGDSQAAAIASLGAGRGRTFGEQLARVNDDWRAWFAHALLPAGGDARVQEVARRSLVSLRLAIAPATSAVVASADTQGPYGEDWIRDGAFLNEMLDLNGFHDEVTRHNFFYASIQASPTNPSPSRPYGNWPMASYADGADGAPIPWEIDETGLGAWTLWRHHAYLTGAAAADYLARVYPAIGRAADFMTVCRDPSSGLQCLASEDDNYTPSQSLHGAEAVILGLRSAVAAAAATGDTGPRPGLWASRLREIEAAVETLYDSQSRSYRETGSLPNGYNVDYGDGGWLLWPVALHPYSDPRMAGEADRVYAAMAASLKADRGQYEAKALLGLARAWSNPTPVQRARLETTLAYMAHHLTTDTGHFGESWTRRFGPEPLPVQDQPHVWEHALFYMSALAIEGARPYTPARDEYIAGFLQAAPGPPPQAGGLPATSAPIPAASSLLLVACLGLGVLLRKRRQPDRLSGAAEDLLHLPARQARVRVHLGAVVHVVLRHHHQEPPPGDRLAR